MRQARTLETAGDKGGPYTFTGVAIGGEKLGYFFLQHIRRVEIRFLLYTLFKEDWWHSQTPTPYSQPQIL